MKRKSVLVGINYNNTQYALRGCVNDVVTMNEMLVHNLGFSDPKLIRMLTDESATTNNILERLEWLIDGAEPGDVLFFGYSGHGSQTVIANYDSSEPDGLSECIVPIDMNWRDKMITDKTFKHLFSKVPKGVNLTVLLDCCHSGSGIRDFQPPLELHDDLFGPTRNRLLRMPIDIANRAYGLDMQPVQSKILQDSNIIPVEDQTGLLIAGCKSNETSADAWIQRENRYQGALTYGLQSILKCNDYKISYRKLIDDLNTSLHQNGFTQHPELDGQSEYFDRMFLQPYI